MNETRKQSLLYSTPKVRKTTICRRLRKTLIQLHGSLVLAVLLMAQIDDTEGKQLCYVWVALSFFSNIPVLVIQAVVVKILSDF